MTFQRVRSRTFAVRPKPVWWIDTKKLKYLQPEARSGVVWFCVALFQFFEWETVFFGYEVDIFVAASAEIYQNRLVFLFIGKLKGICNRVRAFECRDNAFGAAQGKKASRHS